MLYVDMLYSWRRSLVFPLPERGLGLSDMLPKNRVWEVKNSNKHSEETCRHYLTQEREVLKNKEGWKTVGPEGTEETG